MQACDRKDHGVTDQLQEITESLEMISKNAMPRTREKRAYAKIK